MSTYNIVYSNELSGPADVSRAPFSTMRRWRIPETPHELSMDHSDASVALMLPTTWQVLHFACEGSSIIMDAGASGGGYEHAYASQAVYSKDIAAMSREERQKIIQDYQVRGKTAKNLH